MAKKRDTIAWAIANLVLNTIATKRYRDNLNFTISLGLAELERRKDANKTRAMLGNDDYEETR